jgi:hypothetical protein
LFPLFYILLPETSFNLSTWGGNSDGSEERAAAIHSPMEAHCEVLRDRLRKNTPTSRQPWTNHPSMMFASVEWGDQILPFLFLHTWMPIILLALLSP